MGKSTKKLLIVFVLVIVVLAVILVARGNGEDSGTATNTVATAVQARIDALKNVRYDDFTKNIATDLRPNFQTHGNVPVQAGEVGRSNPFAPY